ncbi:MAG: hypothetical protein ACPG06_10230, partial [Alphaproteobacteria bacterium]
LRGALVDFQPVVTGDVKHSVQFFSGIQAADYRTLDMWDTGFSGASWLLENEGESGGSLAFNWVHGHVDGNPMFFSPGIDQQVMSVAGELPFMWGTHSMTVEGELAYLDGDTQSDQRIHDSGHYVALSGQASETALEYKFEYDHYGEKFSPLSASLSPDTRSYTGTFSYGLSETAYMNVSGEQEESALSSGNIQKRRSMRASLSDQLSWHEEGDVSASLDGFVGDSSDSLGFTKSMEYGGSVSGQITLSEVASVSVSGDISVSKDELFNATYIWRTVNASYQRQFTLGDFMGGGWNGYVSPGVTWQLSTGVDNQLTVLTPQFSASLSREGESISASYQVTMNEPGTGGFQPDTRTTTGSLTYSRTLSENSQLSFDANWYHREPKGMESTRAYQVGATYTLQIGKPAQPALQFANLDGVVIEGLDALAETSLPFPTSFRLGVPMDAVLELLLERSVPTPTQNGRLYVYEAPYLPQLQTRQRLALQGDYGRLSRVAILFDLEGRSSSKNPDQVFSEVRAYLFGKLGQPTTIQEDGKLTGPVNTVRDGVATGSVRRTYTWSVPRGRVVFGIPRNPERALRAEISFLPADALVAGPDWGLKVLP